VANFARMHVHVFKNCLMLIFMFVVRP